MLYESITRFDIPNVGVLRIWRGQPELKINYYAENTDMRGIVYSGKPRELIIDLLCKLERVSAVEYTSPCGDGIVVYVEWP